MCGGGVCLEGAKILLGGWLDTVKVKVGKGV